jgi:hypothetical protein
VDRVGEGEVADQREHEAILDGCAALLVAQPERETVDSPAFLEAGLKTVVVAVL